MLETITQTPLRFRIFIFIGVAVMILIGVGLFRYYSVRENRYYKIGIIVDSVELTPDDMVFFKFLIGKQLESINRQGGIGGRPVKALYLDDKGDHQKLYRDVARTIKDKNLIAYIGCSHSIQIKLIRDLVGRGKVPFIGGFTLTQLVEKYPNIYTSKPGIKEITAVYKNLLKMKATKVAFICQSEDLATEILQQTAEKLDAEDPGFKVTFRKWYPFGHKFTQEEIRELADSLKLKADFLVLSEDPRPTDLILEGLWRQGVKMPVYIAMSDLSQVDNRSPHYRAGELYEVNASGIPDVLNMRLEEHIAKLGKQYKQLSSFDFRVSFAGRHADEIGLLKEASLDNSLPPETDIRARINAGLSKYINGDKIFLGLFADWYFTSERSFAGAPLLAWKPKDFPLPVLAPMQFMRTDSGMQKTPTMPVLYADLNMVQIDQVNDEEGTFYATFYLEMYSARNLTIDKIEFANAARNKINQEPLIDTKLIQSKKDSLDQVFYKYLYLVSGKFNFDPDLKRYPFDEQKFSVIMQPKNAFQPFLVQPPDVDIRDTLFESSGWIYRNNYVGYTQDIITSDNDFNTLQKNIPYYKFSFVYEMKRTRVDFTLKTLVPLLAILIITYFSVYIPPKEFEALAGIQVTALLSAIALYFSTYKPEMPYATISDKIFIFTYMMISSLIGTSILLYVKEHEHNIFIKPTQLYQRILFPLIVTAFIFFIRYE